MRAFAVSLVVAALLSGAVRAEVLSVPKDFETIAAALAAAQPGDEVVLAAGTYDEVVSVSNLQDIRLRGQGKVILVGDGTATPPLSMSSCTGVVIERLTVQGSTGDAVVLGDCTSCILRRVDVIDAGNAGLVSGDGHDVLIESCRVLGTGADGIVLVRDEDSTVSRCTVADTVGDGLSFNDTESCTVERCRVSGAGGDGILLGKTSPASMCRADRNIVEAPGSSGVASSGEVNVITDNRITDATLAGVQVLVGSQGGLVQGNRMLRGRDGLLSEGLDVVIDDNLSVKPEIRGFFVVAAGWILSGNRATGAGYAGYELHDGPGTVQDCKALKSHDEGFQVECDGVMFLGNTATGSGHRGFNVVGAGNVFAGNKAKGNADHDVLDHSGENVYFENDFGDLAFAP